MIKRHVDASVAYPQRDGDLPSGVLTSAAQHHEKLDGTGYPKGLSGHQLNELARMAAVVDVSSALTDRRVYKPPMETEAALKVMTEGTVGHSDQALLRLFREMTLDSVRGTVTTHRDQ